MVLVNFLYLTRIKMGSEQMGGALIDLSSDSIIFPSTFKHFTVDNKDSSIDKYITRISKHTRSQLDK